MNLYLMRHGVAQNQAADDFHRPLTDKGAARVRSAVKGMRRLGLEFDALISSPLVRARQTADIAAELLRQEGGVEALAGLSPASSVEKLVAELSRWQERKSLLLVGHEPLLSETVAYLIGGKAGVLHLEFKKSGLCRIKIEPPPRAGAGTLRWLLTGKQLRLLGERRNKE